MLVLNDPTLTASIGDRDIAQVADARFAMLSCDEAYDPAINGYFVLLEEGDRQDELNAQLGFPIMENRFDGIRFGEQGFCPSFEFVEDHTGFYEMVFVLSDDGYGIELFIPKSEGIDPDLLSMCQQYAIRSQGVSMP